MIKKRIKLAVDKFLDGHLSKHGGSIKINDVYMVRMSKEFYHWVYDEAYELWKLTNKKRIL